MLETDAELCWVFPIVNRARPAEGVTVGFEFRDETVVVEDLFHGDGRFDDVEVHEPLLS